MMVAKASGLLAPPVDQQKELRTGFIAGTERGYSVNASAVMVA
jgi:hypothetical protein